MADVGRPSKYTEETIPQTLQYLNNYENEGDMIPSVAGLAVYLGVARETIYDWAKQEDKAEFSDILQTLLAKQERVLFNRGLSGDFNAAITKLALGKHGYHDKQDNTHSAPGGGPIKTDNTWRIEVVDADDASTKEAPSAGTEA